MVMVTRGDEAGKTYSILGTGIGRGEFTAKLNALQQSNPVAYDIVLNVVDRIKAVDILDDPCVAQKLDEVRIDFVRSLQIYLLCTCADALMKPRCKGTKKRFYSFFHNLTAAAKQALVDAFLIYHAAPGAKNSRGLPAWASMTVDEKLEKLTSYLYCYHRCPFTHEAKLLGPVSSSKEQEQIQLIQESFPQITRDGIRYFWQDSDSKDLFTVILQSPIKALRQAIVEGTRSCYLI